MEVQDLLFDPPEDNPYEKFKDQIMSRIADSERQKIWQLLTAEELGDCKPTQLLYKMQQLLGGWTPIDSLLLCELFLQWLPSNVQMILASADEMNIGKLVEIADRIMDAAIPNVTAVSASTGDNDLRKLVHESSMRPYENNKGHTLEVFLTRMAGVGTIRIGGPLHVDVHLTDKQTRMLSVGATHDSVRMPESAVLHARRETPGPAASGEQRGWPQNGSPFICHRS